MPLMPATRPLTSSSIAVATPMITPPIAADQGVKAFQSMVISERVFRVRGTRSPAGITTQDGCLGVSPGAETKSGLRGGSLGDSYPR